MIRFAIVGTGWRSHFFLRTAAACPDLFEVTALVSRTPDKKEEFRRRYGVNLVPSMDDCHRHQAALHPHQPAHGRQPRRGARAGRP